MIGAADIHNAEVRRDSTGGEPGCAGVNYED